MTYYDVLLSMTLLWFVVLTLFTAAFCALWLVSLLFYFIAGHVTSGLLILCFFVVLLLVYLCFALFFISYRF